MKGYHSKSFGNSIQITNYNSKNDQAYIHYDHNGNTSYDKRARKSRNWYIKLMNFIKSNIDFSYILTMPESGNLDKYCLNDFLEVKNSFIKLFRKTLKHSWCVLKTEYSPVAGYHIHAIGGFNTRNRSIQYLNRNTLKSISLDIIGHNNINNVKVEKIDNAESRQAHIFYLVARDKFKNDVATKRRIGSKKMFTIINANNIEYHDQITFPKLHGNGDSLVKFISEHMSIFIQKSQRDYLKEFIKDMDTHIERKYFVSYGIPRYVIKTAYDCLTDYKHEFKMNKHNPHDFLASMIKKNLSEIVLHKEY